MRLILAPCECERPARAHTSLKHSWGKFKPRSSTRDELKIIQPFQRGVVEVVQLLQGGSKWLFSVTSGFWIGSLWAWPFSLPSLHSFLTVCNRNGKDNV